jgi:hypothetical protein
MIGRDRKGQRLTIHAPTIAGLAPKSTNPRPPIHRRSMESRGAGRAPKRWAYAAAIVALFASTILIGPSGLGATAGSMARFGTSLHVLDSGVGTWDNGVVRLTLTNPLPSFSITSDRDGRVASEHSFDRIAEVTPTGNVSAYAPLLTQNVSWRVASAPDGGGTTIWLNATARVSFTHGGWESGDEVSVLDGGPGSTNVSLTFTLNASSAPAPSCVTFDVAVNHWPWIDTRDVLGMEIGTVAVPSTTLSPGVLQNSVLEIANGSRHTVRWRPRDEQLGRIVSKLLPRRIGVDGTPSVQCDARWVLRSRI